MKVSLGDQLRLALGMLHWRELRVRAGRCPLCGPTLFVRLSRSVMAVRCLRCKATPVSLGIIAVLRREVPGLASAEVYEMSSAGPLFEYLRRRAGRLTCSEYFDGVAPGTRVDGVQCQDVQRLTFADESFDACTCTEVFEHVPDDRAGFAEVWRVLRPGGAFVFTVPLLDAEQTLERARLEGGRVVHLADPEYHGDRIRGQGQVLAFRTYGRDILGRLAAARFASAEVVSEPDLSGLSEGAWVIVARKA